MGGAIFEKIMKKLEFLVVLEGEDGRCTHFSSTYKYKYKHCTSETEVEIKIGQKLHFQ